jgi:hypothetical protein
MKTILLYIISTIFALNTVNAGTISKKTDQKFICSAYYIYKYEAKVRTLKNDKQMHCSMSCLLARKCGSIESNAVGLIKEIVDMFTDGTPDRNDLKANKKGIKYAKHARSEKACFNYCSKIYPTK